MFAGWGIRCGITRRIFVDKWCAMSQLGESAFDGSHSPAEGDKLCIFCEEKHQDEERDAVAHEFKKEMSGFKVRGRAYTRESNRRHLYPELDLPPLVEWAGKDIIEIGGYKAAAHHCIAFKTLNAHKLVNEIYASGYDPNRGENCIWLPYSRPQFLRARAYNRGLQKHQGGHSGEYYALIERHLNHVQDRVKSAFCAQRIKCPRNRFLMFLTLREDEIWWSVALVSKTGYRLYADAYLDCSVPWGSFDEEKGGKNKFLKAKLDKKTEMQDESEAKESEDDVEDLI